MIKIRKLEVSTLLLLLSIALIAWRVVLMLVIALTDNTESRYASIAQLTVTHGFWLMPHIQIDQPFFAKPPLSTWLAALSAKVLGISEFSLRLPSLFAGLFTLWAIWQWTPHLPKTARRFSLFAALASPLFFISIGSVMTDATQMACVTLALLCAYKLLFPPTPSTPPSATYTEQSQSSNTSWRWGFWTACGLGMLSKGLATIALIGLPLVLFTIVNGSYKRLWHALWSPLGLLLAALICIPWYIFAELAYPGFLKYFFVGEHWMRFTQAGWSGDQYGHAHRYPIGIIWGFWALAILPWLWLFIKRALTTIRPSQWKKLDEKQRFLWCACLAPLIFFTFTRNLILTYPLTALPPFVALLAYWYAQLPTQRVALIGSIITFTAVFCASLFLPRILNAYSARDLIRAFQAQAPAEQVLIFNRSAPYSAYFYSNHHIREIYDPNTLEVMLQTPNQFIVVSPQQISQLSLSLPLRYQIIHKNDKNMLIKTLP